MKRNIEQLIEANSLAHEKTKTFVESVNHGESQGEVLEKYKQEIQRLNKELLLAAQQGAKTIKIKKG
jgi:hypothetical protein